MLASKLVTFLICGIAILVQNTARVPVASGDVLADFKREVERLLEIPQPLESESQQVFTDWSTTECKFLENYLVAINASPAEVNPGEDDLAAGWIGVAIHGVANPLANVWNRLERLAMKSQVGLQDLVQPAANQLVTERLAELATLAGKLKTALHVIPTAEATLPVSIESPQPRPGDIPVDREPARDDYWEYYDDCDQWDVLFASDLLRAPEMIGFVSDREFGLSAYGPASQLIQGLANKNLFLIAGSGRQLVGQAASMAMEQVRLEQFQWRFQDLGLGIQDLGLGIQDLGLEELQGKLLNAKPSAILLADWLILKIRLSVQQSPVGAAFVDHVGGMANRSMELWNGQVFPWILKCRWENARFLAHQKLEECQQQRATAKRIATLGEELLEMSGQMLQRIELRECELTEELASIVGQEDDRVADAQRQLELK